uniref:Impact RWD domain protein n=1 Tax=Callorhinchus milii TaxID=7868 RepID=A0A4W3HCI0_CALMI
MQILDVRNVMVVVSRWYGGILLGPDRFKHINNSARNILVNEGYSETVVSLSTEFNNAVTAKELAEDYSTLTVPRSSASKTKHVKHSKARSNIWVFTIQINLHLYRSFHVRRISQFWFSPPSIPSATQLGVKAEVCKEGKDDQKWGQRKRF